MLVQMLRVLALIACTFAVFPASAVERGSKDETVALVKKAVALYRSAGSEKALAAFNVQSDEFQPKDLFTVVIGLDGIMRQHAKVAAFNGKNVTRLRDADGKYFVEEQLKVANGPGSGWVEFAFSNPVQQAIENKIMYLEKVDDVFIGVGYYVSRK